MRFLTSLARAVEQLERVAQKYDDEELRALAADLYKQLTVVVNLLEKIYLIYTELDMLVKTDLKLEPGLYIDAPQQPEKLADFIERARREGHDPNKAVAYLLGAGVAQLEVRDGELYIRRK
ncbi:hypothetical protein [Pyrobaculum neutrophilum]|uniref:Uncharacterized protein n=1 Tax=Pyrobaculum neutrophilum (strain DSM 2338 / JCM 9278 / NBRC 100436 / V24Sta) TaxID=444157 RepID=B1YDG0_PYRNV|nr:hypothetical protein [Pyrobaculum neutrophilum]ACB39823.1 conserved hypothetical protein [Pyrobaculum neutrophilum V24Sta]